MLKIYGVPVSVHTRKVIVAAIEKGLQFENEPVIPFTPPPGWSELSPTGKIPVLTDGDISLADSSVICTYLERAYPQRPLYPVALRDHVAARWFEEYAGGTLYREVVHPLFFQTFVRPRILGQASDASIVEDTRANALPRVFGYLERSLGERSTGERATGERATGAKHFAGTTFSMADVAIASNLINYQYLGFELDAAHYPRLSAFFADAIRAPALHAALRAEQPTAKAMGLSSEFLPARLFDHVQDR